MEGAGNGGSCQGQHVHILFQLLDLFLVCHAEALFLVDNQQPQILEFHIFRQYPVGTDHNVHQALLQIRHGLPDLPRSAEPGQQFHPHREVFHSLGKGIVMLLSQDGGGHQIYHLLALLYGLECRPDGNLRLAIPHIYVPVHFISRGCL